MMQNQTTLRDCAISPDLNTRLCVFIWMYFVSNKAMKAYFLELLQKKSNIDLPAAPTPFCRENNVFHLYKRY